MAGKIIQGNTDLAKKIKERRNELGLTIEEAAKRAGVGIKTWCRYEAGESIRRDKYKGVCKSLEWNNSTQVDSDETIESNEFRESKAWSNYLEENYGEIAAASFAVGSDILLDQVKEEMSELIKMPMNSHIGQNGFSVLADMLPMQFSMRYDYDFLYVLYVTIVEIQKRISWNIQIKACSVLEELVFYLAVQDSCLLMECSDLELSDDWDDWIFDFFDDMDIITCLYSDTYLTTDHIYHFDHWMEQSFWNE